MAQRTGTILDVEDAPLEIEVERDQRKVRGMRRALLDTGTVKVRDAEGVVLFYCLSVSEYRSLKRAAEAGE